MTIDFPKKRLTVGGRKDYTDVITTEIRNFNARVEAAKSLIKTGFVDAPYYPSMQSLGLDVDKPYIYKINAPGYFYRFRYSGTDPSKKGIDDGFSPRGRTAILVSSDPSNLADNDSDHISKRMVYMTCSDDRELTGNVKSISDQGNNMFQIPCGEKTYMCFLRDAETDISLREFFFVPTVLSSVQGIKDGEYVTKVGEANRNISIEGEVLPADADNKCFNMFSGNWTSNFRTMFGYRVADDTKITFATDADRTSFLNSRKNWLNSLGVSLSKYGY